MSELKINVSDYVSDETMREIVENECRKAIRNFFMSDTERKIVNTMYYAVYRIVDDVFTANEHNLREELADRMKQTIEDLPSYFIFRRKGAYEPVNSVAQDVLEEESRLARPLIRERIESAVAQYDIQRLTEDEVQDALYNVIRDKLFGNREEGGGIDG